MEAVAVGLSALAPAATAGGAAASGAFGLKAAGTLVSGVASFVASQQQAAILARNAEIEMVNARRTREAGAVSAQDKDIEAAQLIAQDNLRQAASGFDLSSSSFIRRRRRNRVFATRDRMRIIDDAEQQARNAELRAQSLSSQASGTKAMGLFGLIGTGIGVYDDFISSGSLVDQTTARKVNRDASGVR